VDDGGVLVGESGEVYAIFSRVECFNGSKEMSKERGWGWYI